MANPWKEEVCQNGESLFFFIFFCSQQPGLLEGYILAIRLSHPALADFIASGGVWCCPSKNKHGLSEHPLFPKRSAADALFASPHFSLNDFNFGSPLVTFLPLSLLPDYLAPATGEHRPSLQGPSPATRRGSSSSLRVVVHISLG